MLELSNDDTLWAYSIRTLQQVLNLDEERVQDPTLVRLLDIGVHDWHGSEERLYSMMGKDNLRNYCVRALPLGARGHLPCGYMVGSWWVLSKFA
jgi:hypothetical protein